MVERWLYAGGPADSMRPRGTGAADSTAAEVRHPAYAPAALCVAGADNGVYAPFTNSSGQPDHARHGEELWWHYACASAHYDAVGGTVALVDADDNPWVAVRTTRDTGWQGLYYNSGTPTQHIWSPVGQPFAVRAGDYVTVRLELGAPHKAGVSVNGILVAKGGFLCPGLVTAHALLWGAPGPLPQHYSEMMCAVDVDLTGAHLYTSLPAARPHSCTMGQPALPPGIPSHDSPLVSSDADQRVLYSYSPPPTHTGYVLGDVFVLSRAWTPGGPAGARPVLVDSGGEEVVGPPLEDVPAAGIYRQTRYPLLTREEFSASLLGLVATAPEVRAVPPLVYVPLVDAARQL